MAERGRSGSRRYDWDQDEPRRRRQARQGSTSSRHNADDAYLDRGAYSTRGSRSTGSARRADGSREAAGTRSTSRRSSDSRRSRTSSPTRTSRATEGSTSSTRRRSQRPASSTRTSTRDKRPQRSRSSQSRARKARAYREQRMRGRNRRLVISGIALVLSLVLVFLAVRGIAGCVSKAFAPKQVEKAQQTQQVAEKEPVTIELAMIGDILQHAGVYQSGFNDDGTRNYDHVFAHIGSALEGADIKVVNQETVLGGDQFEFSGYPEFNGPQEMGDAEAKAGFNVILRATNHAMDMGYEGLSSELSFWRTKHPDIAVIGAVDPNDSSASVDDLYIYEKDGFKVALLNYTYDLNGYEDPKGVVSILDEEHVKRTVKEADAAADMVVVFPHWGEEYMLQPVQSQRDMAKVLLDAGADVIIGGHPHVIEPVEILTASDGRKVPCFWSVGNFISTQVDNENLVGGVAKVTMTKESDGSCQVTGCSFVPTITHKGVGSAMTTYLLSDYTDALAQTNYLEANETDNTSLTVAWANDFCTQVLGSGFVPAEGKISFDASDLAAATGGASSSASGGSESGASSSAGSDSDTDSGSGASASASEDASSDSGSGADSSSTSQDDDSGKTSYIKANDNGDDAKKAA